MTKADLDKLKANVLLTVRAVITDLELHSYTQMQRSNLGMTYQGCSALIQKALSSRMDLA